VAIAPLDNSFYADPAHLGALKREASANTPEALRETARQFESLFTNMMLKSMRDASSASGEDSLFGSDQQDFYQDMFDQQLSTQLSKGKGLGLADMLLRQLMQSAGLGDVAAPAAHPAAATLDKATGAAATWPPKTQEDFVKAVLPAATAAGRELGIDPATIVAHAALETGWGKSAPVAADGSPSFNLFGIKAGGRWQGETVNAVTHEFQGGGMQKVTAGFRSYESPEHSLGDYVKLLQGSPRYAGALGTGSDAAAYARALQRGGYATDPDYAIKLTAVAAKLKSQLPLPINVTGIHSA
jgi:peptidoglycan hydrolase FlgJ